MRNLADSTLELVGWDGASGTVSLRLTKELGPETGTLRFLRVMHINLPPRMEVAGIEQLSLDQLRARWPDCPDYETGGSAFLIHESWGDRYSIVAEGVEYVRDSR